ncbi:YfiR family protein [Cesiribacter andamanensis]|uniref:DUF4154 domain-containing protein n=1 Tax=Cesiribacter andamanensis AMV16 TaxID=1279009 RepID=M7NGY9_9BACT|nr:YfiR family protein [Cesiribacter andamanensis]EMR01105.1 hypothetical protein ADICEAN_03776 [Cesiribacter andamanensis AMV16]
MKHLFSLIALILLSLPLAAQTYEKNDVYAVFTYRFTKMTEHPSSGDYKIVIFGNSDVAKRMANFHNSVSNGRKILIIDTNKVEDTKDAHMVFIGDARTSKLSEVLALAPNALIITERNNQFAKGSHISFLTVDNKVGFELSKTNSEAKGIKLSKEILTYAKRVE